MKTDSGPSEKLSPAIAQVSSAELTRGKTLPTGIFIHATNVQVTTGPMAMSAS